MTTRCFVFSDVALQILSAKVAISMPNTMHLTPTVWPLETASSLGDTRIDLIRHRLTSNTALTVHRRYIVHFTVQKRRKTPSDSRLWPNRK